MSDAKFVDGLKFFEPRDGAPDFVLGSISIEPKELIACLRANTDELNDKGYFRISVLMSKKGYPYCKFDDYKPKPREEEEPIPSAKPGPDEDLPF